MTLPADSGLPTPRRYLAIAAVSLGTFLTVIDGAIPTVALPTIARDLAVSPSAAVLVVTCYQLTLVMLLLPLSALGDRVGHRRMYQGGQWLFTIATILCFFAHSLPVLLVVRVLQAIGAGAQLSVMSALIRAIYPARTLGRGLGFNSVMTSVAAALAPTAGGMILEHARWPWVFAAAAPLAIFSLALGRAALPDTPPRRAPYNIGSALLNVVTFGLIVGGLELLVHGTTLPLSLAVVGLGVAFAVALVRREMREPAPILPVDLLGRPALALSAGGALLAFVGSTSLLLSTPFRLQHGYGLPPGIIGYMLAPWPFVTMIVSPAAGALSDRFPSGMLGAVGMAIAACGLLLIAFLPVHPGVFDVGWRMALTGVGFGLYISPNARLMIGSAPRERAASAGGLISTTRLTGQTLGATLVATMLSLGFGDTRVPALVATGLALAAGLCSVARLRPPSRRPRASEAIAAEPSAQTEFHGG